MSQRMPVVRQLHRAALIPQFFAIATLTLLARVSFPSVSIPFGIFLGALVYLFFCRIMRAAFVRDHRNGMRAYYAQKFTEAISHFGASYRFFSSHRWMDRQRSLLFGVAARNPYRVMALCNMAYCHTQNGDGQKAIELYEQALREEPDCKLAEASLKMLRSSADISSTTPRA